MALISFAYGLTTWEPSRNPDEGTEQFRFSQASARSAGGTYYGYDAVVAWEIIPLSWSYLPDADVAALITWLEDAIGWLHPFTLHDADGATYTAELDTPTVAIEERIAGGAAVTLTLRRTR